MQNVTWRPKAAAQYTKALDYIAERDEAAGRRIAGLVNTSVDVLRAAPNAGRRGRVANTREWVVHPNYLIIYRVSRGGITILRFLHARQRYP